MKTALTIAGSDSSGGAGIQADIKTMTANGVFALCAVTALTAQNTTGVTDILESTPHFLAEQLDAVFTDIFPDAVKIGMVSSIELIRVIAEKLRQYGARHIVVDPVMVATSGANLLRPEAVQPTSCSTFKNANSRPPRRPKDIFTVSMALFSVRPPIRPERKNSVQPMMWPMTIAAMPFPIPSGAKAVPVRISARETPAPNQIRLF